MFPNSHLNVSSCRRMKLKKEIQAIKELNEQEKQAQAAKAAAAQVRKKLSRFSNFNIKIGQYQYLKYDLLANIR